ncbi:hypothetical protein [Actinophytocola sp.]|uniref:hypothetical protein n=1 Tax=Actinophytocola sp. TaxID=1872138 RepID=UPI002ED5B968
MSNPIEAQNRENDGFRNHEGASWFEGAGLTGGAANAIENWQRGDASGVLIEAAGVGLDSLGVIASPWKSLGAAGIGWLLEHVGFLNDFLSALAGDPGMVADQAQTWTNIGDQVTARVEELRQSVSRMAAGQQGGAVTAYNNAVEQFAAVVADSAFHAYSAANAAHAAGTLVGTTRALLRDWFAEWSVDRVTKWIAASALTPVTFGGAQAAFITDSVISSARLASRASGELRTLARQLDELAAGAASSGDALKQAARALDDAAGGQGISWVTRQIANAPGMTKASRFADEGALARRTQDLGGTARKHVDDLADAQTDVGTAAAQRATTGKKISERGAPGTQPQKNAAHGQAKRRHTSAQARVDQNTGALVDIAHQAQKLADDVDQLHKKVAADKITAAAGHGGTKFGKEFIVQGSNQDQRAAKAEQGYRDQQALLNDEQKSVEEPPRDSPRETWHVRGTLEG